jgi:hypothetical protein
MVLLNLGGAWNIFYGDACLLGEVIGRVFGVGVWIILVSLINNDIHLIL